MKRRNRENWKKNEKDLMIVLEENKDALFVIHWFNDCDEKLNSNNKK